LPPLAWPKGLAVLLDGLTEVEQRRIAAMKSLQDETLMDEVTRLQRLVKELEAREP
jgi:hypothetical protein